ncbi:MAG TPA: VanZ family protein [Candidatus Omnitrophota bacterium]|nr:VanZ family protein [Candidatus Omnitrophota bacterium]
MDNSGWSKFFKFWFPAILYSGIIFWVSSQPHVKTPMPQLRFDAVLHLLAYMPFGFLLARAVDQTKKSVPWQLLFGLVLLGAFVYGISDEFHQSFVPGRSAEAFDLIADTIGGGAGGYIYLLFAARLRKK